MTYDDAAIRQLMGQFGHPMVAIDGASIVGANQAYADLLGYSLPELEGKPVATVLAPEEEQRVLERAAAWAAGRKAIGSNLHIPVLLKRGDGQRIRIYAQISSFPATNGRQFLVSSCWLLQSEELQLAEQLGEIAGDVSRARSESEVRASALRGLQARGLGGGFFWLRQGQCVPLEGETVPARAEYAASAVALGRAVFEGGMDHPENLRRVYLPIHGLEAPAVLLVEGESVSTSAAPSFLLFSRQLSSALANARLITDLQRSNAETALLLDLANTISATLELETILDVAGDFLVKLLDVSNCFFMLVDDASQELVGAGGSHRHRDFIRTVRIPLSDARSFAARVVRERRPLTIADLEQNPELADPGRVRRFGERALLGLPMLSRHQAIGAAVLDDTRGPRTFSGHTLELAQAVVGQVALSVANARLYHSLRDSYAQLEQTKAQMVTTERLAALGQLSAVIAHEVRNPLGVVFNAVSSLRRLLAEPAFSPQEAELLLQMVVEECDRLNRMVGDLLDFARPRELMLFSEDLCQVLEEAVAAVQQGSELAEVPRARFELTCQGLPRVAMDRRLVRQALINVLANAAQSMGPGGAVRVWAAPESRHGRAGVRIDIQDQGPGLSEEHRQRIFEPFFTTKARGTGLGLAVVKRIVDEHSGHIEVQSAPGRGTTVSLWWAQAPGAALKTSL